MAKSKPGLHKEIRAIFGGVPIPKEKRPKEVPEKPVPSRIGYVPVKPQPAPAEGPTAPEKPPPVRQVPKPARRRILSGGAHVRSTGPVASQELWGRIAGRLFASTSGVSRTRQIATALMVPLLIGVFVLVLMRAFDMTLQSTRTPPPGKGARTATDVRADIDIDWRVPPLLSTTLRDPMRLGPRTAGERESGGLVVKGITHDQERPYAIVGTRIVQEGDKVLGATVTKINRDSVEFEMDGTRWVQKVQGEYGSE